jgi:tripartite ATP-independent transporter DctP family solute receptor
MTTTRRRLGAAGLGAAFAAPLLLVAWGVGRGPTSSDGKVRVLRLGHSLNRDHPVHKGMEFMAAELDRLSGGRLRIEIYPDEQLGPERDLIELLQMGSLALTKVSTAPLENFSPLLKVFSLPYLFRDRKHFWRVLDGPIGEQLLDASIPYRLKGLCYYDAGARSFYISRRRNRVIRRPEDLEGLSIRVQRSQSAVRLVELLGAKPIPIPFGELYTALDTGTVDGAENNPPSLYTTRQYEVTSSYTLNEHTFIPDILIMSLDAWRRLAPEEQTWLHEAARASSLRERELWQEAVRDDLATMEKAGLVVVRDVDKEPFRERTLPLYDDPDYSSPEVRDLVRRIRELGETGPGRADVTAGTGPPRPGLSPPSGEAAR